MSSENTDSHVHESRGLYFEDLEIGASFTSPGRTITETDVISFAGVSGDYNELHTNAEYAAGTSFGQRIAHGLLGLAVASGLIGRMGLFEGTAIAFVGLEWKFKAPIFINDTVHVRTQVEKARAMRAIGGGMVILKIVLSNQRGEAVQEGTWRALLKSRTSEGKD